MAEFLLLMHSDYDLSGQKEDWELYLAKLEAAGVLRGGSAIGAGLCVRREGHPAGLSKTIVGYIKIEAQNLLKAKSLLLGNPAFEAGGTVEIRELLTTS